MRRSERINPKVVSKKTKLSPKTVGIALATTTIGAMAVAGALAAVFTGGASSNLVDESTGCLLDRVPPATTLAVLDGSDTFDETQRGQAIHGALKAASLLPPYGRMTIIVMNAETPENPTVMFSHCVPEHAEVSSIDHGAVFERRAYHDRIEAPMQAAINEVAKTAHNTVSPVAETISAVSRLEGFDSTVPDRTLVVISDMLQNDSIPVHVRLPGPRHKRSPSAGYSQYSYLDLEKSYRSSALFRRFGPDLRGVRVVVVYLERPEAVEFQTAKHRLFWTRYLIEHGAKDVEFSNIVDLQNQPKAD